MNNQANQHSNGPIGQTPAALHAAAIQKTIISEYGKINGDKLLRVVREPVDPQRDEYLAQGYLCTNKPIYKYSIETIDITSSSIETNPEGKRFMQFNRKQELMFPITDAKDINEVFPAPTTTSVSHAINRFEVEGKITYFTDHQALVSVVNALNDQGASELELLSQRLLDCARTLKNLSSVNLTVYRNCMSEIGVNINS